MCASFFRQTLASTEGLDYSEALDWFGLRFTTGEPRAAGAWTLGVRTDATAAQQAHLRAWLPGTP
jgi:hypothetical protein